MSVSDTTGRNGHIVYRVDGSSQEVTVANTYPDVGKLKLQKRTTGVIPVNTPSSGHYTFNVTLTDKAGSNQDLTKYDIYYTVGNNAEHHTLNVASGTSFRITIDADEANDITIENIPDGTTFYVQEDSSSTTGTTSVTYSVNGTTRSDNAETTNVDESTYADGTITGSATQTATVTNAYPGAGT